jgi:hypothetical protein
MDELEYLDSKLSDQLDSIAFGTNIKNIFVYTDFDKNFDYITSIRVSQSEDTEFFLNELEKIFCGFWKGKLVDIRLNNLHIEYLFSFKYNNFLMHKANFLK